MNKKALGKGLPKHVKEREMRMEFSRIINAWKSEGYNVSRLEGIMDLDIESISQAFALYDNDIRNLKDIAEIIEIMETTGFENEVESIRSKLKNPDEITQVLQEVHDLDQKIKITQGQVKSEEQEKKVSEWSSELNKGKDELMDLWEQSEQEAIVKDPGALEKTITEGPDNKQDSDIEDRLSSLKERLSKLSMDKTIPLRSDKIEMASEQPEAATTTQEQEPVKEEQITEPEQPSEPEAPVEESPVQEAEPESAETQAEVTETEPPREQVQDQEPPSQEPVTEEFPAPPSDISETVQTETEAPSTSVEKEAVTLTPEQKSELDEAINLAKEMYRKQEYQKAIEYFNMALEIDPMNSDAIFFKKRAESKIG